jgi:parallel beta-helix repeat protein
MFWFYRLHRLGATALIAATALAVVAAPTHAAGKTRWVDDDGKAGPAGCASARTASKRIQPAVNASGAGDTVRVCPGTYVGNVTIQGARDGLTLVSHITHGAIIRPPAVETASVGNVVQVLNVHDVEVTGFSIRPRTQGDCGPMNGFRLGGATNVRITSNLIRPSTQQTAGSCGLFTGILAAAGTTGFIGHNVIRDYLENGIEASGAGTDVEIESNTIRFIHVDWDPAGGNGVRVHTGAQAWVDHNTITVAPGRDIVSGVELYNPAFVAVRYNVIDRATNGIRIRANGAELFENTTTRGQIGLNVGVAKNVKIENNKASLASLHGIWVSAAASGTKINESTFTGNGGIDCVDQGGLPLDNTWTFNDGDESNPAGICEDPPA